MDEITYEDLDDLWGSTPPPPRLYKYLTAERIENVLRERTVRFTPMLNTNDSFEVRITFEKLIGPKMACLFRESWEEVSTETAIKEMIATQLDDIGLGGLDVDYALQMLQATQGIDGIDLLQRQAKEHFESIFIPAMNSPEAAMKVLERVGSKLLGFSLAEDADSAMMWAHYAGNHTGLVVAFDTSTPWFTASKSTGRSPLRQVTYRDELLDELLDDPRAALVSKTKIWEHEKEWRMYSNVAAAPLIVGSDGDPIHLFSFPEDAVCQIIVGHKASQETVAAVCDAAKEGMPEARILRAAPDRATASMKFLSLQA